MDTPTNRTQWIVVVIGIIILGGIIWYFSPRTASPAAPQETASSTVSTGGTATSTATTRNPTTGSTSASNEPSLDRAIPATPGLDASARAQVITNVQAVSARLQKDPSVAFDWVTLGSLRLTLGDYTGAALAWEYAAQISPKDETAFANLGYVYATYLNNYPKAEADYRIAVGLDPKDINAYGNFFDLYQYHYKQGTSAAADILKQGIAANPKDVSLQVMLARYYKGQGRTADAKAEYAAAIANANSQGQTGLATQLQTEEAAL